MGLMRYSTGAALAALLLAIGIYGLTQAILQIPFGWASDRFGRKPLLYIGSVICAATSRFRSAFLTPRTATGPTLSRKRGRGR